MNFKRFIKGKKLKSIQFKLMSIVGSLLIVSLIIANVIILNFFKEKQYDEILGNYESQMKGIVTSIEYFLKGEALELNKYVYDNDFINFSKVDINELKNGNQDLISIQNTLSGKLKNSVDNYEGKYIENEYLINKDGIVIAINGAKSLMADVSNREYFKNIKNGKDTYISNTIISNETKNCINVIARKISDENGNFIGAVCKDVIAKAYDPILQQYNSGKHNVFLTDKNGVIIYNEDKEFVGKKSTVSEIDNNINKDNEISQIPYTYKGEKKLALSNKISEIEWNVYSVGTISDIEAPIRKASNYSIVILIIILIIGLIISYYLSKKFTNPIKKLTKYMNYISDGNLSIEIKDIATKDEIEQLANAIDLTRENLAKIITNVRASVETVNDKSQNLLAISEEVSASNIEIAQSMDDISQKIYDVAKQVQECESYNVELDSALNNLEEKNESMIIQSNQVGSSINENNEKIVSLVEYKEDSAKSFSELKYTMEELFKGINNISSFLELINNIAKQTNLLSLNAAIEAARAGEAGRGFAVVSNEIKNLSNETQQATDNILSIIDVINNLVSKTKVTLADTDKISVEEEKAFKLMEEAFKKMQVVLNKMVKTTTEISNDISIVNDKKTKALSAVSEISSSTQQIAAITEEVNASISEQQVAFETVNSSVQELEGMSENLSNDVEIFKI